MYSFVLTLWCLTCVPQTGMQIHNIDVYEGRTTVWADLYCREMGNVLSGGYARMNALTNKAPINDLLKKDIIIYSCSLETDEI